MTSRSKLEIYEKPNISVEKPNAYDKLCLTIYFLVRLSTVPQSKLRESENFFSEEKKLQIYIIDIIQVVGSKS